MTRDHLSTVAEFFDRDLAAMAWEVEAIPESMLWSTVPGVTNPVGTLALHVCGNLRHFVGAELGGDGYVRDRDAEFARRDWSRERVIEEIETTRAVVRERLGSLDEARLAEPMPSPPERYAGCTVAWFLAQLTTHLAWHLGHANYLRRILTAGNATD
jgi:hypothetical protein